jgi:hypothetical protein
MASENVAPTLWAKKFLRDEPRILAIRNHATGKIKGILLAHGGGNLPALPPVALGN